MAVVISLLRAVNVGGHNIIKMEALRALYESLGLRNARSYVQSGNVVFKTDRRDLVRVAAMIADGVEREFGFRIEVIVRSLAEMRLLVSRNPFAGREGFEPAKLLVGFLAAEPTPTSREAALKIKVDAEELRLAEREIFIYFPNGMGRSKLSWTALEKALKVPGTGRNWNTVTKLLALAEETHGAR